jgi:purine catabolism regulator
MRNGRTLPREEDARIELLKRLAKVGVSALIIGDDPETAATTENFVQAADDLQLPVLQIPYSVSFVSIGRAVADANARDEARRLARTERIYEIIRRSVGGAPTYLPLLGRLERELACHLFLLDTVSGEPISERSRVPSASLRAAVLSAVHENNGAIPARLHLNISEGQQALAVEVPYVEPTVLLATKFSGGSLDVALLQHAATAVAVEVVYASMQRELERRMGAELFAHLVDSRLEDPIARQRMTVADLDPASSVVVAIGDGDEQAWADLHISLARRGIPQLLLRRGEDCFALVPDQADAFEVIRCRLGPTTKIGISDRVGDPLRTPLALREARWALAAADGNSNRQARYGDKSPVAALRDAEEAQVLVDSALGVLIAYDEAHQTDLLRTVEAFLSCRRSWQRTATELHLHKQTVVYRIRRVEELTGRSLSETADIAELWLALRAYELLSKTSASGL